MQLMFRLSVIAVRRPHMRFVPVKDESLCLHRIKQGFIEEKTAIYNRLRGLDLGLISEFGIIAPQSTIALRHMVSEKKSSCSMWILTSDGITSGV